MSASAQPVPRSRAPGPLSARMQGPGGYYNAGNLLGLAVSLVLLLSAAAEAQVSGISAIFEHFLGSPAALGFSAATAIFLIGGEVYYRAWQNRDVPDMRLNRLGDLLSALGAMALTFSLLQLNQPLLAVVSGLCLVAGKLGNALLGGVRLPDWPARWGDPFRLLVLVGRVPAVIVAGLDLIIQAQSVLAGQFTGPFIQAATLVVCLALWIKADLMLARAA